MKVPRDGSESRSEARKPYQRTSFAGDVKTSEDNKDCCGSKAEEGDVSNSCIEPITTALIPPWLRNSLGLAEKGDAKPNQKCLKIYCTTNDRSPCMETGEAATDSDGDRLKCHFYVQDSPSANPILEVNIGSEADFRNDSVDLTAPSPWRSKSGKYDQYECSMYGITKDGDLSRPVKSEVTSIDVVVPTEDQYEEKSMCRPHKGKSRIRRTSNISFKSEDNRKNDANAICRSAARFFPDDGFTAESSLMAKNFDERLLLLCGKKVIDNLTEEDVALLQEMKKRIGHKEGFETLFSEIRESAFAEKVTRRAEKKEEKDYRREATKDCDKTPYFLCKNEESRVMAKNKAVEEDRKYLDDLRKHYEKKSRNQQKQVKHIDELEVERDKKPEKWKGVGQRTRETHAEKEKKSKLRHCDYSIIEKVVSETLQKFIELYRIQVPPDVINSMKRNIIQTLHSEYQEMNGTKRGLDAVLALQDQLKSAGMLKCNLHHLLIEEREDKQDLYKTGEIGMKHLNFTPEENVVSKDVPSEHVETLFNTRMEVGKPETLKILRKDFETCLELIQHQLDVTGSRLCSVILEKIGTENKKLRIVHNFSNGVTESLKIYDRLNKGSPEGDNINTAVCDCQQNFQKMKRNQWSQTREKVSGRVSTQTDLVDVSVKHLRNADLTPGLYRITKATESGRFYLTPEVLDDDDVDADEDNKVKRVSSEIYARPDNGPFTDKLLKCSSRETFVSERGVYVAGDKTLWRAFRSDCLGLNNRNSGELSKILTESKFPENGKSTERREEEAVEIQVKAETEVNGRRDFVPDIKANDVSPEDNSSDPEGYHRECVWLWNGKRMSPGMDLKVHVEDLLREKLNEILCETKIAETKNESAVIDNPSSSAVEKNLEIRKTRAKFCITSEEAIASESSPFIFRASGLESTNSKPEGLLSRAEETKYGKSVREVGTQNSQHTIVSLNISNIKPRSKLCTVAKFSKRRQLNVQNIRHTTSRNLETPLHFAESVGEAKKVKLEFREANEISSNQEKGSNSDSVRECFSIISNGSSSSNDGPVRVKLIGIEVSKEKSPEEGDFCSSKSSETKSTMNADGRPAAKNEEKKYKHWDIIENVLNRVSQKEKDILWNEIRDFVKKKIGRDINDEGAREVCIELEQDISKFAKGKASRMVVARGNYTRNEGDVEVEVDLTLDDLERILRHRQKKLRRRMHTQGQKTESKESSTSSDTITDYPAFKCRPFFGEDYITSSEVKILKEHN